ncbi:MAG: PHP domain-containing protein, partial [Chloroflexi bacterium]|nr:PHP domain-containing protein [Chloroflexota bacterium]
MGSFCHLHVLSQFSMRHSLIRLEPLLARVKELDQPAMALTDRNGLYGVVPFIQLAGEYGIHPVIGCELFVHDLDGEARPVTLLAETREGYSNLCRLSSHVQLADQPAAPREVLVRHQEGLILLTGGAGAEIPALVAARREHEAIDLLRLYQQVFPGRCYIELMAAHRAPYLFGRLRELSTCLGIPPVVTQD